jgi:hypothetical protein
LRSPERRVVDRMMGGCHTACAEWLIGDRDDFGENQKAMNNQAVLALVPIVGLIIIVGIVGFFFALKERRESREQQTPRQH